MARGAQQGQDWNTALTRSSGIGPLAPEAQGEGQTVSPPTQINNPLIPRQITQFPPASPQVPGGTKPGSSMNPGMRMRQ